MSLFTKLANYIFSPVDSSGAQRSVLNADAQVWGTEIERLIMALVAEQGGDIDLPNLLIRFTVTGGTENAIAATANLPIPTEPGLALFSIQIAQDNTGPVTINGKPWLTNVGNPFVAGGIKAGGIYLFLDNGDHYRAVTDQDVSALVAAAEAFAVAAAASALEAAGHATGAIDYVYLGGVSASLAKAVDDGDLVPAAGVVRRVSADAAGGVQRPFTVICTTTGAASIPLPGAWQSDGTFGILTTRWRVTSDRYVREAARNLEPLFVEQFLTGFYGRGMLAAETNNVTTEQAITGSHAAGATTVSVTDNTHFLLGGTVVIRHDNGRYWSYFVMSRAANVLTIRPALKWAASAAGGSRIERLWYNRAHPGKFYMRMLAQRLAHDPAYLHAVPQRGRYFYTRFANHASVATDQLVATGGASVTYEAPHHVSPRGIDYPVENPIDQTAVVSYTTAASDAVETQSFDVQGGRPSILRFAMARRKADALIMARVLDQNNAVNLEWLIPAGTDDDPMILHTVPFRTHGSATRCRVQFINIVASPSASQYRLGLVEVFEAVTDAATLAGHRSEPLRWNVTGDSWAGGDVVNFPEREPINFQLAKDLPDLLTFNGGTGGFKVQDLNGQAFEEKVAATWPTHVAVSLGTNDSYNPASGVFDPSSIDFFCRDMQRLISDIIQIGARPVIFGPPALAEADASHPDATGWFLNDRARKYNRALYERLSHTLAGSQAAQNWTPVLRIGGSDAGIAYSVQDGMFYRQGQLITFSLRITLTSKGAGAGQVTITLPTLTAGVQHIVTLPVTYLGMDNAQGLQAAINAGNVNEMRLQMAGAAGVTAATEANLTNATILRISGSYLSNP